MDIFPASAPSLASLSPPPPPPPKRQMDIFPASAPSLPSPSPPPPPPPPPPTSSSSSSSSFPTSFLSSFRCSFVEGDFTCFSAALEEVTSSVDISGYPKMCLLTKFLMAPIFHFLLRNFFGSRYC